MVLLFREMALPSCRVYLKIYEGTIFSRIQDSFLIFERESLQQYPREGERLEG